MIIGKIRQYAAHTAVFAVALLGLLTMSAGTALVAHADTGTTSATSSPLHIMVMKHLCNSTIHNIQDFENIGAGKGPIATLAADVLACPTTGLPGNAAVAGSVASPRATYDFMLQNGTTTQTLSAHAMYAPHKLCESDINLDVNNDGTIATSTCLDVSHYQFTTASTSGQIMVTETMPPTGFHFGALRFTPTELSPNNDEQSLVSIATSTGMITLHTAADTDGMVMLHVYNFPNATTTGSVTGTVTGTGTTTPTTLDLQTLQNEITHLQSLIAQILLFLHNGHMDTDMDGGMGTTSHMMSGATVDQNGATVRAGTTIDFGGHNFGSEEHVTVSRNGTAVGTGFTNRMGGFSTGSMPVPSTLGMYTYTFVGQHSGITATATVTVTP